MRLCIWSCDVPDKLGPVPKLWVYTQAAIVVFIVAGMVIAITRLA